MRLVSELDAMDAHTALIRQLQPYGRRDIHDRLVLAQSIVLTTLNADKYITIETLPSHIRSYVAERAEAMTRDWCAKEIIALTEAQTIFCSAEISHEVYEAAETMLDTTMLPQDVFVPNGIVFFEQPYEYFNRYFKQPTNEWCVEQWDIHAIQFNNHVAEGTKDGVALRLYGHWRGLHFMSKEEDPKDFRKDKYDRIIYSPEDKSTSVHYQTDRENPNLEKLSGLMDLFDGDAGKFWDDRASGSLCLVDATTFVFGENPNEVNYDKPIYDLKKFMLALFRLTYEYLEATPVAAPKPFVKRAKREKRKIPESGYLVTLKLRRSHYDGGSGNKKASPNYAFRVRGHWKRAYLPSTKLPVGNPHAYRHIYIKDYIKGRGHVVESRRLVNIGN